MPCPLGGVSRLGPPVLLPPAHLSPTADHRRSRPSSHRRLVAAAFAPRGIFIYNALLARRRLATRPPGSAAARTPVPDRRPPPITPVVAPAPRRRRLRSARHLVPPDHPEEEPVRVPVEIGHLVVGEMREVVAHPQTDALGEEKRHLHQRAVLELGRAVAP